MLEVHAPDHAVHGVRDFFMHLFTISVGLLIALGLENAAEAWHHRHQRIEAQAAIRHELEDNQAKLKSILAATTTTRGNMLRVLQFLIAKRDGTLYDPSGITLGFSEAPLESTNWQTAMATGAASYIAPEELQRYAKAYQEQQGFIAAEERALMHIEQLDSYLEQQGVPGRESDPTQISKTDAIEAIPGMRDIIADLSEMRDTGRGTLNSYTDVLGK